MHLFHFHFQNKMRWADPPAVAAMTLRRANASTH